MAESTCIRCRSVPMASTSPKSLIFRVVTLAWKTSWAMLAEVLFRFSSSSWMCSSSLAPQYCSAASRARGRSRPVKRRIRLWCTRRHPISSVWKS